MYTSQMELGQRISNSNYKEFCCEENIRLRKVILVSDWTNPNKIFFVLFVKIFSEGFTLDAFGNKSLLL